VSARARLHANRLVSFVATMPKWSGFPRWVLIMLGFQFAFHIFLFAIGANWWNDPVFLPTSPAGGR